MPQHELAGLAQGFILYGVMPVWIAAGFADWLCHRRSRIEHTSGLPEAALHALMLVELGLPTLLAAFFEINALVIALMAAGFVLHQATVYVDLRYASARRDIPPIEQLVHSFIELTPVVGAALVLLFHWPAVLSLLGLGGPPDFGLHPKTAPLPATAVLGAAIALLVLLPYAEELWRCARAGGLRGPGRV